MFLLLRTKSRKVVQDLIHVGFEMIVIPRAFVCKSSGSTCRVILPPEGIIKGTEYLKQRQHRFNTINAGDKHRHRSWLRLCMSVLPSRRQQASFKTTLG